jgi:hypothetical protein
MTTLYANILVVGWNCVVADYSRYNYHVKNVSGLQYCFKGLIYDDNISNYTNIYDVGLIFPIRLFLGKKDGDQVKLFYSYMKNETLIAFDLHVTCKSKHNIFENDLYKQSCFLYYDRFINVNRNLHNLIAYNTHVDYCISQNKPVIMEMKSYEPILLCDYINIGNQDVINFLIKPIYIDLFINQIPKKPF